MDIKNLITQKVKEKFPEANIEFTEYRGDFALTFDKKFITGICNLLKEDEELKFLLCEDIAGVDWGKRKDRFSVIYHLFSLKNNFRIRLRIFVDEKDLQVDSVSHIFKTANWHERETYDMFGIIFKNHPDLRRMYLPEEFEYHPLRKEFPLMGVPGSFSLPGKGE